jgi:hypothetical protein
MNFTSAPIPAEYRYRVPGKYLYAVMLDGTLRIGKESPRGHLEMTQGEPVLAAGVVGIDRRGFVTYLDDKSIHYRPGGPHPEKAALRAFRGCGFRIKCRYRELYGDPALSARW